MKMAWAARWLLPVAALCCLSTLAAGTAGPADAARRRYRARRPVPRPATARSSAARPAAPAAPVRNVIFFIADGYHEEDWRGAREAALTASAASGPSAVRNAFLAMDRMPVTGIVLPPLGVEKYGAADLGLILGTGNTPEESVRPLPLLALARQYGRSVALVAGHAVTDPLPGAFAASIAPDPDEGDALRQLAAARVDVLFGRDGRDMAELLSHAGYKVATDAQSLLLAESVPAAAITPAENVPFETLTFRALHLVARGPRGLMMAVAAQPSSVSAAEFSAAVSTALTYARRDARTLVLVADRHGDAAIRLYAYGQGAEKFSGTIAATDVPKIVAGLAGLKVFRRDFSPLFAARSQPTPAPTPFQPGTNGRRALPW